MKLSKKTLLVTLMLAVVICLAACNFTLQPVTVTLDNGDGTTSAIYTLPGKAIDLPQPDERDLYEFIGWKYQDEYVTSVKVYEDVTVTAEWKKLDRLAQELRAALKTFLQSEEFESQIASAVTTQARVPMLYLRYVKGNFYSDKLAIQFKHYLNMVDGLINAEGKIDDSLWPSSAAQKQGWYGIFDYFYSFSLIYNQYQQWCYESGNVDDSYALYIDLIKEYLHNLDAYFGNNSVKYEFNGKEVSQANLYYTGYNAINNMSSKNYRLSYDQFVELLGLVSQATGNTNGHKAFLNAYKKIDFDAIDALPNSYSEYNKIKGEILALWKGCMPVMQIAFGYTTYSVMVLSCYNLGFDLDETCPISREYMLSYYDKDEDGNFKKNGGTPNWVGFSGRPLAGSIFRNDPRYDVKFEKTMQGYFPFTNGWNQPLDEMINMDRLCNFYNHTLGTSANVAPYYGLLYGFMNGIDMEHYQKEVYHSEVCPGADVCKYHIDEEVGQIYNIVSLWKETLKRDEEGNIKIRYMYEAQVAIAYIALTEEGIEAPSPLGVYNPDEAVIDLGL